MYWSTGFWRLEFSVSLGVPSTWGLPFALSLGRGGHDLCFLCLTITWWRGSYRYEKRK